MFVKKIWRKKGIGYRVYVKKNGKQDTKVFDRKYDAYQWGQETESRLETGSRINLTFYTLANEWLENHSKIKNAYSYYINNVSQLERIKPVLGHKLLHQIGYKDIEALVKYLKEQDPTRSNTTINRYLSFVRAVLNYAVDRGDLLRNPIKKKYFLPQHEVAWQYWQLDEANVFMDFAEQKYSQCNRHVLLVYKIALNTGMRLGEIVALKWDAVVLSGVKPYIVVKRSVCSRKHQVKETTKSKQVRHVGINEVLLQALGEAYKKKRSDFVVSNQLDNMLNERNFVQRHFEKDIKEAEISRIRFHDLRHTYASNYMMNGGSLYDLQKILGHYDMKMTERYAHLSKNHILDKANVVVIGRQGNVVTADFKSKKVG